MRTATSSPPFTRYNSMQELIPLHLQTIDGNAVRSTQSISIKDLVMNYSFNIISPVKTKKEVQSMFRLKYRGVDWWSENINE